MIRYREVELELIGKKIPMLNRNNSSMEDYSHYSDNENVDYEEEEMELAYTNGDFNPLSQHAINNLSISSASPTNNSVA